MAFLVDPLLLLQRLDPNLPTRTVLAPPLTLWKFPNCKARRREKETRLFCFERYLDKDPKEKAVTPHNHTPTIRTVNPFSQASHPPHHRVATARSSWRENWWFWSPHLTHTQRLWRVMLIVQVGYLLYLLPYLLLASGSNNNHSPIFPYHPTMAHNEERNILLRANDERPVISAQRPLVVATRLHLGKATSPPTDLEDKLQQFAQFCFQVCTAAIAKVQSSSSADNEGPLVMAVVAVDATPKLEQYDLLRAVRQVSQKIAKQPNAIPWNIQIVPVQPWGRFVPALNALVVHAATVLHASRILFVSAETTTVGIPAVAQLLQQGLDNDVLVVGARLSGHDHHASGPPQTVALTGRTTPWNTLAIWNVPKLSLTGFQLVSDGLISDLVPANDDAPLINMGGVEETVTIALLQQLLGQRHAVAKLIAGLDNVTWNESFDDPARQQWHDQKMASKLSRAQRQLDIMGLSTGTVVHLTMGKSS